MKSCTFALFGLLVAGSASAESIDLEPYQLVRSVQRVQDAVVLGDVEAIGMQKELFRIVRADLSALKQAEPLDARNLRALLSFAIAGGGGAIIRANRQAFSENPELDAIAAKVERYSGRNAAELFADINPIEVGGILGATIALVRAQVGDDLQSQIADLNFVRCELPGTIFEEAAIRGLLTLSRRTNDRAAFAHAASRYARTFGKSPYATKYAEEVVSAAIALDTPEFRKSLIEAISFLPSERREALAERIKRAATIVGQNDLYFAVETSEQLAMPIVDEELSEGDKIVLDAYNNVSTLTAQTAEKTLIAVQKTIPTELKPENRRLRSAVIDILATIISEPIPVSSENVAAILNEGTTKNAGTKSVGKESDDPMEAMLAEIEEASREPDELNLDKFLEKTKNKIGGTDKLLEELQ